MNVKRMILALVLAFTIVLVACTGQPSDTSDQTGNNTGQLQDSNEDSGGTDNSDITGDADTTPDSEKPAEGTDSSDTEEKIINRSIAPDDKEYFFGISPAMSHVIPESEWEHYKEAGIKSIRVHLQDGRDWTSYDRVLERAAQEDIEVMMLVSYETYDSESEPFDKGWGPILHFTDPMELVDVLAEAIPYFKNKGVTAWEIWNEQNGMWHLHPDEYAELITTVYERCKYTDKWDENAIIVFGGLDSVNVWFPDGVNGAAQQWAKDFYNTEHYKAFKEKYGHSPFDVMAIHPYNTIDVDANLQVNMNDLYTGIKGVILDTMEANGDGDIPVWITELGDQDPDDTRNAEKLEQYMKTCYEIPQITRLHWFKYTYVGSDYSIVRESGTPRESFYRYVEVVKELTGKE